MDALSFGVELEMVFFYQNPDKDVVMDDDLVPLVDITRQSVREHSEFIDRDEDVQVSDMEVRVMVIVDQAIKDFVNRLPPTHRGTHIPELGEYQAWQVDEESISLFHDSYPEWDSLNTVVLEIISPAMYATEEAFREVEAVANMIRTTFRTAVPPGSGFHVHVGQGRNLFPLNTLKRLATVCWAGDLIMRQLHPLSRRYNYHCLGARTMTNNSRGNKAADHHPRWPGQVTAFADRSHIQGHINAGRPRRLFSKFHRTLVRGGHNDTPSQEDHERFEGCDWVELDNDELVVPGKRSDIIQGAAELMSCQVYYAVSALLGPGRNAYNFEHYDTEADPSGEVGPLVGGRQTVEFRQAAGSLNGHWISTWARICVGMARFAATATDDVLWRLVYDCYGAEKQDTQYDVLDLLLDLGLCEEAKTVQRRLETGEFATEMLHAFSPRSFGDEYGVGLSPRTLARLVTRRVRRENQRRNRGQARRR